MLSIIICSIDPNNLERAKQSINRTSVFKNELIVYENKKNLGLCKIYNESAGKAKSDFLCFVHEDVVFDTKGWDEKILNYLKDEKTGVVGIMGGRYQSFFGAGWRNGNIASYRMNVKDGKEDKMIVYNPGNKLFDEVMSLDGAFLCCHKRNWQQHPFDEHTFKGFHFYDIDFCLKMHFSGLKNIVAFDILLEHFSQGNRKNDYLDDFLLFQKKWKKILPASLDDIKGKKLDFEGYALAETLALMKKVKFSKKERWRQMQAYNRIYKSPYHFLRSAYFGFVK